jgi:hypothetical protein
MELDLSEKNLNSQICRPLQLIFSPGLYIQGPRGFCSRNLKPTEDKHPDWCVPSQARETKSCRLVTLHIGAGSKNTPQFDLGMKTI